MSESEKLQELEQYLMMYKNLAQNHKMIMSICLNEIFKLEQQIIKLKKEKK